MFRVQWHLDSWSVFHLNRNTIQFVGFDISGHCFLMVYSMLIMSEEAKAFRNWSQVGQGLQEAARGEHEMTTRVVQFSFVGMFVLSLIWIKQLFISTLYYHIWYDKVCIVLCFFFHKRVLPLWAIIFGKRTRELARFAQLLRELLHH